MKKANKNKEEIDSEFNIDEIPDGLFDEPKKPSKKQQLLQEEKLKNTSCEKKMWVYIENLQHNSDFKRDLIIFRKRFNLKEGGYEYVLSDNTTQKRKKDLTYPYPKELNNGEYSKALFEFARKYKITVAWAWVLDGYIFYNKLLDGPAISGYSMMNTIDLRHELLSFKEDIDPNDEWGYPSMLKNEAEDMPIAILLHPYVSQRDVIDYIKKVFRFQIEPKLKEYRKEGLLFGKVRKKNDRIKLRNQLIFQLRNIPRKELLNLMKLHFHENLTYSYLARIVKEGEKKYGTK